MLRFLIAFGLIALLIIKVLPYLAPIVAPWLGPHVQRRLLRLQTTVDVAGGLILIILIAVQLVYGNVINAVVLALIGLPIFVGTYRALPGWWRGK